jgi:hypothetical protein
MGLKPLPSHENPEYTNMKLFGYMDIVEITEPNKPIADTLRLYVEDIEGFSFYKYLDSTGMKREVLRDSMILVYNNTGSGIVSNRVVHATGSFNNFPTVGLARSNSISTMPAVGVTIEDIADNSYGRVMQVGILENIDTSAFSVGDVLYVHNTIAGVVRKTSPLTPNLSQEIGTVLVSDVSSGAIQIIARGLTGDEYGTAQNSFSIGDGAAGSKTLVFNAGTDLSIIWDETQLNIGSLISIEGNIYPATDDTYYIGKNDDDTPFAWKGIILKDQTNGKYYRVELNNGAWTITDLTD